MRYNKLIRLLGWNPNMQVSPYTVLSEASPSSNAISGYRCIRSITDAVSCLVLQKCCSAGKKDHIQSSV